MIYSYGTTSLQRLNECHKDIQTILFDVILVIDVSILEGHRGEERQNQLFKEGRSTLQWPHSKHNVNPSLAVDIAPYPIIWPDSIKNPKTWHKHYARFHSMMGMVKGIAFSHGIAVRFGLDWNNNNSYTDQSFDDLPHFELMI